MNKFFLISIILTITSCAAFKSQKKHKKVVEGSYMVVKQEANLNNPNSVITGIVYDKESNAPIKGAIVQIKNLKQGQFTGEKGQYSFEIEKKDSKKWK